MNPIQQLDVCLLYSSKCKHVALIFQLMQCSVHSFDSKLQKNMILSNVIHSFINLWLVVQSNVHNEVLRTQAFIYLFIVHGKTICTHVKSCKNCILLGTTKFLDNLFRINLVISKCPCVFPRPSGYFVIYSLNKNHTYIYKTLLSQMYIAIQLWKFWGG